MFEYDIYGEPSAVRQQTVDVAEPDVTTLRGRERRESERVIAYWEKRVAQLGSGATLAALDLAKMPSSDWSHRFVIALAPRSENSALLYYGADFARLLELPGQRTPRAAKAVEFRRPSFSSILERLAGYRPRVELPGPLTADTPIVKQLPERFSDVFLRGCGNSQGHETPVRLEGEVEREDGRRELYRAAFIPVVGNENTPSRLAFGAFSSRVLTPALAA